MKISAIFEVVPDSLYSVQFDGEPDHEFSKVFRLWSDAMYLESFFGAHMEDLLGFWECMSAKEAGSITKREAGMLEKKILNVAVAGSRSGFENLSDIFKPLITNRWRTDDLEKSKTRGSLMHSWLRVYAVRMNVNKFVISGGAIKLTRTMNEREHLERELRKLEEVCQFLREDRESEFGLFELS